MDLWVFHFDMPSAAPKEGEGRVNGTCLSPLSRACSFSPGATSNAHLWSLTETCRGLVGQWTTQWTGVNNLDSSLVSVPKKVYHLE